MRPTTDTAPLLKIDQLVVSFDQNGTVVPAVQGVSLQVNRGETLALVGESGSGKSVTANTILRLLPKKSSSIQGSIQFEGKELTAYSEVALQMIRGASIAMIFQEPMTALNPLHTVERQIGEVLNLRKTVTPKERRNKIRELLAQVEIPEPEKRLKSYPHQLSGGQRQRVMIAMAIANQPKLLIADEPTTALDVTIQKQILELIRRLQKNTGMAVLLITHDLGVVRHFSDRVAVMRHGKIVEHNETQALFTHPKDEYTRMLLDAEPHGAPAPVPENAELVAMTKDLRIWYPIKRGLFQQTVGHVKAVDDISLTLRKGETLGIVGESGSGKTTLAQAILRLISSEGVINVHNVPIHRMSRKLLRPYRRIMQIVFQDPFASLSPRMSVSQIVAEGLEIHHHLSRKEREARVADTLRDVGLPEDYSHRFPHELSGGQRQRVAIARALILKPEIIVLDEPTSALDRSIQAQVIELLRNLQKKYELSYLFISHDLKVVRAMSHQILVMKNGKVVETGNAEDVFQNPQTEYTRQLLSAAFISDSV
ncbi:ABC peptide transporter, fused ATPase domains [gamma proteobacterium HdN1]|nr:ABC peptide transporter, fused ATPase domains [gamma proteobacterium HdN1]